MLLEPLLLGDVSLFGVVLGVELLGLLLVLEPMLPELLLPAPWLALPAPDVPPDALLAWPFAHSSLLIWPSWFVSSFSNSLSLALEEALEPPAALPEDLPLEPEAPEVALGELVELEPPAAELLPEDEDDGLLCDIEGEDDWALLSLSSA